MRFREVVSAEFDRRRQQNPRYSMRGFARGLGIHHSTLSRLLGRGRPLQSQTIATVGTRLGCSLEEIQAFTAREDLELIRTAIARPAFRPRSRWLASIAGISIDRVNVAIHTLLRRGHLKMLSTDRWSVTQPEGVE